MFKKVFLILLLAIITIAGCDSGRTPTEPERQVTVAISEPAVFVKGITYATSWGNVIVTDGVTTIDTGYIGSMPVIKGDYIYFIDYVDWYYPVQTQPVKLNWKTGVRAALGNLSTTYINDQWISIDAAGDGKYLIGKHNNFTIYNANGAKIRSIIGSNPQFTGNGAYVIYSRNYLTKIYKQAVNSSTATYICPGYIGSGNNDGTKICAASREGDAYKVYYWDGATKTIASYGMYSAIRYVDMCPDGRFTWDVNIGNPMYWFISDGTTTTSMGLGFGAVIKSDYTLYSTGSTLMSTGGAVGTWNPVVMQIN